MADALQLLKEDHRKVQDLFKQFERADDAREKKRIVDESIHELEIHSQIEEEIFYPAVAREAKPGDDLMEEAEEEHHVVDLLIAELRTMRPQSKNYDAKFTVLAENVKHHIQEEESEMLPMAAELGSERMLELGALMAERKAALMMGKLPASSPTRTGSRNGRRANGTATRGRTRTRKSAATKTSAARRGTRSASNGRKRSAPAKRKTTAKAR